MRIMIDGRSLQNKPWTGVGQYTYNLLRAIFDEDHENEYSVWYNAFDCGRLGLRSHGDRVSEYPAFPGYPNVRIIRTHWPNKILNLSLKLLNSPQTEKADIFFMPNLNFIALPPMTKLIIAAHDLSFEHFPEFFSRKSRLWHKAVNPRALFNRADHIIAVSEHTKADLMETYKIPDERVSVAYPAVDFPINRHCEERSDDAIPEIATPRLYVGARNDSSNYILYFGALEPRKNIEGLIEAYETLKDPPNLIIAGRSGAYATKLKKKIKKSKYWDKIKLMEDPDEQKKKELYAGARLFVYPSFYEGFGFPPLEAMSAGVPVIASSAASVPEICGGAALLVNPFNVNEIKQGMKILLEDHTLRQKYILAGYEKAKQFSWHKCAEQTLEIFQKLCPI